MAYFSSSRVFFIDYTLKYCKWSKPPFVHCKRRRHKTFLLFLSRVTWMTYFSSSRESFFYRLSYVNSTLIFFLKKKAQSLFYYCNSRTVDLAGWLIFHRVQVECFSSIIVLYVYLLKRRRNYNQFIFLFRFNRICMPCFEVDISWNNVGFLYFVKHNFFNRLWCWWHHLFI